MARRSQGRRRQRGSRGMRLWSLTLHCLRLLLPQTRAISFVMTRERGNSPYGTNESPSDRYPLPPASVTWFGFRLDGVSILRIRIRLHRRRGGRVR